MVLRQMFNTKNKTMKKLTLLSILAAAFSLTAFADKIEGEASCPKCALKEADKCGIAIKTATGFVYARDNAVEKEFHKQICKASANVTAEGTITEKDGKKIIVLEKIELAK